MSAVLAASGDCIKILDLDGNLIFMSEGGKRVMEVDDFEVLRGCPWPGFWPGESNDAAAAVAKARAGQVAKFRGIASTAKGNPRTWDVIVSPIVDAAGVPTHLLSVSRDISEEATANALREKAVARERFLSDELEHRVKNTFTLILSVAAQTFRGDDNAASLATFNARVIAMAKAHDVLHRANWIAASLQDTIEAALAPHASGESRFVIAGPAVNVGPKQAMAVSLAMNELATNATKYGALSHVAGRADVKWSVDQEHGQQMFTLTWIERDGPPVTPPSRKGFGSRVINDLLRAEFGGNVRLEYLPTGMQFVLTAPYNNLSTA